ncbi:uncharacterized protein LOC126847504 [Adelges cooleyi]|uniref:uncharacterized protein LOC126847504 n=1 Tax=Adelges cooleyi TaxID=133065 RepID=UPI00217F6695|nr:uncharacterized protein LOC126847504 [Adelges cooleyi]
MDLKTVLFLSYITTFVILTMTTGGRSVQVNKSYNPKVTISNKDGLRIGDVAIPPQVYNSGTTPGNDRMTFNNDSGLTVNGMQFPIDTLGNPIKADNTDGRGQTSGVKKRPLVAANTDGSRQTSVQQTGLNNENVPNQPVNIGVISAIKRFIGWLKNCGARGKENPAHL